MKFIDLDFQYELLKEKISNRLRGVLESGSYIMGPEVLELEEQLKSYVGVGHCVTCANGTDALQLSLMALGLKENDRVITTPFTFFATAEAISIVGAEPIFIDIEESSYNISPEKIEAFLSKLNKDELGKIKAIIAVDLFGLPANYAKLKKICQDYNLFLIGDGAQSFGGEVECKKTGSFGEISTTSFFPAKPLGCYGDGGAVFTDSKELADLVRSLRVHGKGKDKYDNIRIGLNSRLDTIQAAVLLEKLMIFDNELHLRQKVANYYQQNIGDGYIKPSIYDNHMSAWAQYSLRCKAGDARKSIQEKLNAKGIPTQVYYKIPLHLQTAFRDLMYKRGDFPVAEKVSETIFSIPMHPYLKREDQDLIIEVLNQSV